jgi:cytosine/adenosine deaminase-related metal-dependent hydrolase
VTIESQKIVDVDRFNVISTAGVRVIDLGNGAIIPGLVNAHTHLEFSDLESPLGQPGINFTDWIRLVVSSRSETSDRQTKTDAIAKGLSESFRAGVWAIGEIATSPFRIDDYISKHDRQALLLLFEQLGQDVSILPQREAALTLFLDQQTDDDRERLFGASPHAPYSVHPKLLEQICRQAIAANRPLAMHVAETQAERELLEQQTGDFVSLLQDFGAWNPNSFGTGNSIADILTVLSRAPRSLIIHGNYLTDMELDLIADRSDRMSIVYCPRTHHYFGHPDYPIEAMLERGILVGIGTDSRASNPDLDLFLELKHVAREFRQLDPHAILEMGTLNGAKALGISRRQGSLTVGKQAAMSFVSDPSGFDESPFDWMFSDGSTCTPIE